MMSRLILCQSDVGHEWMVNKISTLVREVFLYSMFRVNKRKVFNNLVLSIAQLNEINEFLLCSKTDEQCRKFLEFYMSSRISHILSANIIDIITPFPFMQFHIHYSLFSRLRYLRKIGYLTTMRVWITWYALSTVFVISVPEQQVGDGWPHPGETLSS